MRYKHICCFGILVMLLCSLLIFTGCQTSKTTQETNTQGNTQTQQAGNQTQTEQTPDPGPAPEPEQPVFFDPLTGLATEEETLYTIPVGVMINNYHKALPQYGIEKAGILYECEVEGSITRLFAIFNNYAGIPQIGPVRSARDYFIDLSYNHDAYYIHYGGSPQAYTKIKEYNVHNLDGIGALDTVMYWRDKERLAKGSYMIEHSVFTSGEKILKGLAFKSYETKSDTVIPSAFSFSDTDYTPDSTETAIKITIPYGNYVSPVYTYNEEEKVYFRSEFDAPHIDGESQNQLSFKNVIILYDNQGLIKGDTAGRLWLETTGTLDGLYITNGVALPITCIKDEMTEKPRYYTADNKRLIVNCGKTMINYVNADKEVVIE